MELKISRRNDPTCEEVRGWVYQKIARKFKALCKEQGIGYSEGLEEALLIAIQHWQQQENSNSGVKDN